jgi:hypothetical protein
MDKLRTFYLIWTRTYAASLVGLGILIEKVLVPFLSTQIIATFWLDVTIKIVTSSTLFVLLYLGGEKLIRNYIWKSKFFYKQLNLDGLWVGCSYYTNIEIEGEGINKYNFQKNSSPHDVNIYQDSLEIKVQSSPGSDFVNWGSNAADLTTNGTLKIAYEVKYGNEKMLNKKGAKGYEEMDIIQTNKKGLPILLSGIFSHCADGTKPIYRGKTLFFKKEFLTEINEESLDEDFKTTIKELKNGNK